jgi:uroporphyrin-III C-methyltransferase/precorrin-2 dehydrogenase/sirohydrochlorin ferrochelatase
MAQAVSLHSLPLFVRLVGRPVILLGEGEAADAKRRLLDRAGAQVVTDEAAIAALAIVAIDNEAEALAAVARLKARGVLVNAVDRSAHCDFTLPAIVDREPVLIAIGTGGASAGLAAALRQRLEALVPADLGGLANALQKARGAMRARFPDGGARRRALADALAPGGVLDPLGPSRDVAGWLDGGAMQDGTLVRMSIASPDPDDLTLRQARALASADRVYHRADVPPAILDRARADAARIACDAAPSGTGPGLVVDVEMGG